MSVCMCMWWKFREAVYFVVIEERTGYLWLENDAAAELCRLTSPHFGCLLPKYVERTHLVQKRLCSGVKIGEKTFVIVHCSTFSSFLPWTLLLRLLPFSGQCCLICSLPLSKPTFQPIIIWPVQWITHVSYLRHYSKFGQIRDLIDSFKK